MATINTIFVICDSCVTIVVAMRINIVKWLKYDGKIQISYGDLKELNSIAWLLDVWLPFVSFLFTFIFVYRLVFVSDEERLLLGIKFNSLIASVVVVDDASWNEMCVWMKDILLYDYPVYCNLISDSWDMKDHNWINILPYLQHLRIRSTQWRILHKFDEATHNRWIFY